MAVFTSFSDESAGKDQNDTFLFAGWIGPETDWSDFFVPAWEERVLAGPPRIPYLHVTDMRSPEWREANGVTLADAENRIDNACVVLDQLGSLQPLRIVIEGEVFFKEFGDVRVKSARSKQFASTAFEPDYVGFLTYAWGALRYLAEHFPGMEKLDFVVERKAKITRYIQEFHADLPLALTALGNPELARLVGGLIPGEKDRTPLQAADVLCWHCARREKLNTTSLQDKKRYKAIAYKKGARISFSEKEIKELKRAFSATRPESD